MKRFALVSIVLTSFAACGSSTPATSTTPATGLSTEAPIGTLTDLVAGDLGCYASISVDGGEAEPHLGDFELCPGGEHDASALKGQAVTWTTAMVDVPTAECQGDPECGTLEPTPVVQTISAAP